MALVEEEQSLRCWSIATLLTAVATVVGCAGPAPASSASSARNGPIEVRVDDTACALSTADAAAGTLTFNVTNTGAKVSDFYFYYDIKKMAITVDALNASVRKVAQTVTS